MANIIDKGQITLQGGAIMSWNITDDEVLTISGALWDGSVTVGKDIKSEAKFRHLVLDESVQAIGVFNFSDWDCLEEVTLPPSIKCIEHAAFCGCKNLKRVNLSDGLEIIGADSFCGCESLETIIFPSTLKEIYEYAFAECCSLHDVLLPAGVSLGTNAFDEEDMVVTDSEPFPVMLCSHIKTLLHERALSELTLYACDFCGGNTIIDNFEDFIEVFGDTLPWDDIDINDFTWDDSRDLYGILREYNHHEGIFVQIVRQIRSVDSDLQFKIERRCFNTFEEVEYYEESELLSLEQLVKKFGEESVTAHLEKIYRTLTSAEWLFELNNMKRVKNI